MDGGFGRHGVLDPSGCDWFNLLLASFGITSGVIRHISYIFQKAFSLSD